MDDLLTRSDLDQCECNVCQRPLPIKLSPACHPDDGVYVHYHKGVLVLKCKCCEAFVCSILVAVESVESVFSVINN